MRDTYWRDTHVAKDGEYWQRPNSRIIGTLFGKIRYWRTYVFRKRDSCYPLDIELGLPLDGFSMTVRSYAARLATKMSYAQSVVIFRLFFGWSPCQKTVEEMVLGLGWHTQEWFEKAPAPEGDGEVLIIQIDSKGTPTATEEELAKRRGPRPPNDHPNSPRHRRKEARDRRGSKKRKKKGDKTKNAKMATIVVIYSLKRSEDGTLEGPINKRVYASYAPKRHAVAIARREADKRGFTKESHQTIQILTDGDNDLSLYIDEYFPEALHTIDVFHVLEYLWNAAGCLFQEGSEELEEWYEEQKEAIYEGRVSDVIKELETRLKMLSTRGPGMKSRRERLEKVIFYLSKRKDKMDYKSLRDQDLEISSGAVEGAVKYVIAKRFDSGGMRWIRERSETLLQLRCIEINEDWDNFIDYVHNKTIKQTQETQTNVFLKSDVIAPLPTFGCN